MKLKKGDIWKAIVLVVLIVAVFGFIVWTLVNAGKPRTQPAQAAQPNSAQTQAAEQGQAAPPRTGSEMFAPRQSTGGQLLAKAQGSPDPFYPTVSPRSSARPSASNRYSPGASASLPAPWAQSGNSEGTGQESGSQPMWVSGIVSGAEVLAVVRKGDARYFVKKGDALPGGWTVERIGQSSITIAKQKQRIDLELGDQPEAKASKLSPIFIR